MQVWL